VLPLAVSQLTEPINQRCHETRVFTGNERQESDAIHLRYLLRRGQRGSERTGQRVQQEAAAVHYSITWSARSSSDGGMVRPSAFAVLRLMTSSNLVGCCIGRSDGLAPLRILST